ncbi:hypothetical protein AMTRI_Chr06g191600 [Amborella trichopoda]
MAMATLQLFLGTFFFVKAFSISVEIEISALLSFKSSITSDPLHLLSNWVPFMNSPCNFTGITCDEFSGKVTGLNLAGKPSEVSGDSGKLAGILPHSLGSLTDLRVLSLSENSFSSEIPGEIGFLSSLEVLDLSHNNFSGKIPHQISFMASLSVLNLSFNSFSGKIPASLYACKSLQILDLRANLLNGTLPPKLVGSSNFKVIDLSFNSLSGGISMEPSSECRSLTHLHLSGNFLAGRIPKEIGNCTSLQSLLLPQNVFEGHIPAEIGRISHLRVLDVSGNCLTGRIPRELSQCKELSVLVLTNWVGNGNDSLLKGEFNAFEWGIPYEIFLIPRLKVLWAPMANIGGRLPKNWSETCSLEVLNIGFNSFKDIIPEGLGKCRHLAYLDLNSNAFSGHLPVTLRVPCMIYFNVSGNSLSGRIPNFGKSSCGNSSFSIVGFNDLDSYEKVEYWYLNLIHTSVAKSNPFHGAIAEENVILHDFSSNAFVGVLPLIHIGDSLLAPKPSYGLLLNDNKLNGSLPSSLFALCKYLQGFAVNLSTNQLSGKISSVIFLNCSELNSFEAAYNQLDGPIPKEIGNAFLISQIDLRGNRLNGTLPDQLGTLKNMKQVLLGENTFTGGIPVQLSRLSSLQVLDLSSNNLTGSIPSNLAQATQLQVLLLDHNALSGEIPSSFSELQFLTNMNLSYNNLSGYIPVLKHSLDCTSFKNNVYLQPCTAHKPSTLAQPPYLLPPPNWVSRRSKLKSFEIALVALASAIVLALLLVVLYLACSKRHLVRLPSLRKKLLVTFTDTPPGLTYENVVRATGNFSIRNLIGTGGFGATYKAELVPGFLVAVKRLSLCRFQGLQQFGAEIRTLGRIRHANLVTLIGYYMSEAETFLIYNYLPGGNLERFIHDRYCKNLNFSVIHKIAMDIAQALVYLHYSCEPRIVHRDIKPSNILLDNDLNAYLSDFGLARLLEVSETHATTDVAGTFGYVAPEYATTCRVSDKADVYSFGVVMLEMLSGKRSLDPSFSDYGNGFNIVAWGKLLLKEGRTSEVFCSKLWDAGPQDELVVMLQIAAACTAESLAIRPSMKMVLEELIHLKH